MIKSLVSFTYDGNCVAIGQRKYSTYQEILDVWQSTELITG